MIINELDKRNPNGKKKKTSKSRAPKDWQTMAQPMPNYNPSSGPQAQGIPNFNPSNPPRMQTLGGPPNRNVPQAFNFRNQPPMMGSAAPMQYGPTAQNSPGGFNFPFMPMFNTGAPDRKTIDEMAKEVGLDYSKDYAEQQAAAVRQAREDGLKNSMKNTQRNLLNAADDMDRSYFVKNLNEQQNQVNAGLNAGIASDRDLRLQMARQAEMGDLYANANSRMDSYTDELNRLDAEELAQANEMYNNRREQGFQNWLQYNQMDTNQKSAQFNNNMQYWQMLEDIRRDGRNFDRSAYENDRNFNRDVYQQDRNYALQEGELTGNYVSHEARGMLDDYLQARQAASQAGSDSMASGYMDKAENIRRQLAAMGVDVSSLDPTQDYASAMNSISSINPTLAKQDMNYNQALDRAKVTGQWIDPRANDLIQQVLNIKRNYESEGRDATPQEVQRADAIRAELANMGVDTSQIVAPTQTYREALRGLNNLPQDTQSQKAQDYAQSLDRAKMTGNWIDPRAYDIAQQILDIKRSYESEGRKATPKEIQQADTLRAQLASMGVDTDRVVAADQTYREALSSMNNLKSDTFDKYQYDRNLSEEQRQFNDSMNWDKSKFGQEMAWDKSKFGQQMDWEKDKFGQSLAFDYANLESNEKLKREAMDLDRDLAQIDYSIAELDADVRNAELIQRQMEAEGKWDSEAGQQQRMANTSAVMGELAGMNRTDAIEEISRNAETWASEGVDISSVLNSLGLNDILSEGRGGGSSGKTTARGNGGNLGSLSERYESGGDPGAIGWDSTGGSSYGTYQIATKTGTMNSFLSFLNKRYPNYRKALLATPGTSSFNTAWKRLAKDPGFAAAQHNFIKASHYDPAAVKIKKNLGININSYPKAVQDVLWSTAVQHGSTGAYKVFRNAGIKPGMDPATIINRVYSERGAGNGTKWFGGSTAKVRRSVVNRFANERKRALSMLG